MQIQNHLRSLHLITLIFWYIEDNNELLLSRFSFVVEFELQKAISKFMKKRTVYFGWPQKYTYRSHILNEYEYLNLSILRILG